MKCKQDVNKEIVRKAKHRLLEMDFPFILMNIELAHLKQKILIKKNEIFPFFNSLNNIGKTSLNDLKFC